MHGKKILTYELQELARIQSIMRRDHPETPAAFCDYDNYDAPFCHYDNYDVAFSGKCSATANLANGDSH